MKIMKDHGLDGASENKLKYDIAHFKPKTPVNELFNMVKRDSHESENSNKKMTVAKPFDFQTAKRIRIQNQIDEELFEDGDGSKS